MIKSAINYPNFLGKIFHHLIFQRAVVAIAVCLIATATDAFCGVVHGTNVLVTVPALHPNTIVTILVLSDVGIGADVLACPLLELLYRKLCLRI